MQPNDARDDETDELKARDLALRAGVSRRTVHYYAAEGLLPAPVGVTRAATYSTAHLARLRLILALREEGLSLASIRQRLTPLGDAQALEVAAALDRHRAQPGAAPLSTLGLIDAAVQEQLARMSAPAQDNVAWELPAPAPDATSRPGAASAARAPHDSARDYIARVLARPQSTPTVRPPSAPAPVASIPSAAPQPETWRHYPLADGVELRVREDRFYAAKGRFNAVVDTLRDTLQRHGLLGHDPPDAP